MQDVPKFVLKRLQETPGAESHPDADVLTAFAERSLLESERARVLDHLAHCEGCREVVSLAVPATEDAVVTVSPSPRRDWPGLLLLRWGVVAAAFVGITAVGILEYQLHHKHGKTPVAVVTPQTENKVTADLTNQPPPASSGLQEFVPSAKNVAPGAAPKRAQSNQQDAMAKNDSARFSKQMYPAARGGTAAGTATGAGVGGGSAGGKISAPPAPATNPNAADQSVLSTASSEVVQVEAAPAAPEPSKEKLSDKLVQAQKEKTAKDESSESLDAASPSPRWSIGTDGTLQRSFDGGQTWNDVNVEPPPTFSHAQAAITGGNARELAKAKKSVNARPRPSPGFRALAAFGSEVWVGGSAATLYHSTDAGAHWARVLPSSPGTALTGDITSIEFSDPQHGRIATTTGEVWITADAGQTWRRQ